MSIIDGCLIDKRPVDPFDDKNKCNYPNCIYFNLCYFINRLGFDSQDVIHVCKLREWQKVNNRLMCVQVVLVRFRLLGGCLLGNSCSLG